MPPRGAKKAAAGAAAAAPAPAAGAAGNTKASAGANADANADAGASGLTEYELQRLAHIRRNQEYMARLGVLQARARARAWRSAQSLRERALTRGCVRVGAGAERAGAAAGARGGAGAAAAAQARAGARAQPRAAARGARSRPCVTRPLRSRAAAPLPPPLLRRSTPRTSDAAGAWRARPRSTTARASTRRATRRRTLRTRRGARAKAARARARHAR
jgi:hypothetical protein